MAAYSPDRSGKCSSRDSAAIASADTRRCSGIAVRRASRVIASLPASMASSRRSFANHCLILVLARGEATKVDQSRLGPAASAFEVKISTTSPDSSLRSSATSRPFTREPMQRLPTSVCTA
jgi:hypothetical protein